MVMEINGDTKNESMIAQALFQTKNKNNCTVSGVIHNNACLHICSICNKQLTSKQNLMVHVLTHTKIINQICDLFGVRIPLSRHQENKPANCEGVTDTDINSTENSAESTVKIVDAAGKQCKEKDYNDNCFQERGEQITSGECHDELAGNKNTRDNTVDESSDNEVIISDEVNASEKDTCSGDQSVRYEIIPNPKKVHSPYSATGIEKKDHTCEICGKEFAWKASLRLHNLIHTGQKPHYCGKCDRKFRQFSDLKRHKCFPAKKTQDKRSDVSYNCLICNKHFTSQSGLNRHKLIHNEDNPYKCGDCGRSFLAADHLKAHMLVHSGEKPHACGYCSKQFSLVGNLNRHIRNLHSEADIKAADREVSESPMVKCNEHSIDSEDTGAIHSITNTNGESEHKNQTISQQKKVVQENTAELAKNLSTVHLSSNQARGKVIQNSVHVEETNSQLSNATDESDQNDCQIENGSIDRSVRVANKSESTQNKLESNLFGGSNKVEISSTSMKKIHFCSICHRRFKSPWHLKDHVLIHTGERPYCCSICKKSFNQKSNMNRHMLYIHKKKCINERSTFGNRTSHQVILSENQQIPNSQENTFTKDKDEISSNDSDESRSSVGHNNDYDSEQQAGRKHEVIHKLDNPSVCPQCGKKFSREDVLKQHMLVHSGQRPHHCMFCDATFSCIGNRNRHVRRRHKDRTSSKLQDKQPVMSQSKHQVDMDKISSNDSDESRTSVGHNNDYDSEQQAGRKNEVIHKLDNPIVCAQCGKKFSRKDALKQHMRVHSEEMPHHCMFCDATFSCIGNRNRHVRRRHKDRTSSKLQDKQPSKQPVMSQSKHQVDMDKISSNDSDESRSSVGHKNVYDSEQQAGRKNEVIHKLDNPSVCAQCGKKFSRKDALKQHMRVHSEERPHHCMFCDATFKYIGNRNRHVRRRHKDRSSRTLQGKQLVMAKSKQHPVDHPENSENLKKTAAQEHSKLSEVLALDHSKQREEMTASTQKHIQTHDDKAHNKMKPNVQYFRKKVGNLYVCVVCGRRFTRARLHTLHMLIHTGQKSHPCPICGKLFLRKQGVKMHMRSHVRNELFACEICGKQVTSLSSLRNHVYSHTGEKRYTCEVCGKRFMWQESLHEHKKCYTEGSHFTCDLCNKHFELKKRLNYHIRNTHFRDKSHACSICNSQFKYKGHLNNHMTIHTGEKPHECEFCEKRFRSLELLKAHLFSHSGKQPFSCKQCNARFKRPENLRTHMLIHEGKKPHSCPICGKNFRQSGSVKIHIKRVHDKL